MTRALSRDRLLARRRLARARGSSYRRAMKKFLKWGCLVSVTLVVVLAAFAWRQVRRLRTNLEVAQPLQIAESKPDPQELERLTTRVEAAHAERVLRLRDVELTYLAQRALAHPAAQAELAAHRHRAINALKGLPDPMGFLDGLKLDDVDLTRARADVRVADQRLHVRLTAPYRSIDRHLNVQISGTGGWAPNAVRLQITRLQIGEMDVMALPFYTRLIEARIDTGVAQLARMKSSGPISDVRIEENAVLIRLKPGGASVLREAIRRYLR